MNSPAVNIEYQVPEGEVLVSKTDLEGIITYCNNTLIEVSGYNREELISSPHNLLRHPDMPTQAFSDLWKTIRANKPWRGLIKNLRKDGSYYWLESNITPLIENGKTTGYVSFHYKTTAEQIRHAQAAYRAIREGTAKLRLNEGKIVQIENRLVHWLNASSIKFRLVAFMSFLFSTLVVFGVYNLREASNTHGSAIASLEVNRMEAYALDTARLAEMDFKEQLQTWKNILISIHDSAQQDQYLVEFDQQGVAFESRLSLLKSIMLQISLPDVEADAALKSHRELTRKYHDTLKLTDPHQSGQSINDLVKNIDLATIAHIEMIISTIQDAQQNRLRDLNLELDKSHQTDDKRAIAMLMVAAVLGLFLSMRFVMYIMHPIRSANSNLKKVVKLQQHFLKIILKLEVYRDRIDEEQRVGNFIMSRMNNMDHQLAAIVHRYTRPAEHLSGDVLIAAFTPSNTTHILLADAIGHGLTAAINVLPLCQTFYEMTHKGFGIDRIADNLNKMVNLFMPADRFVSATLISIDRHTQVIKVWNGGIPAIQLFNLDGHLLKSWDSHNLPLGILSEDEFSAGTEAFRYQENAQLCLFSDGLVEATSPRGEQFGCERIIELFGKTPCDVRFDALIGALDQHLQGQPAHDDISLAIVDISTGIDPAVISCRLGTRPLPAVAGNAWRIALSLSADELKYLDIVPLLTRITTRIHVTREHNAALFLILSELFNNVLNQGVLGLEAHAELCSDDYEKYLELRDTRLKQLGSGSIELQIEGIVIGDKPAVKIRVAYVASEYAAASGLPVEIGVELTQSLAYQLECSANEVVACYICA
ncbi:MAG: SpoIIE family protein phosphatase [Gallionella sp.]|jgi:PAS domain S-box-containing protein